MCSKRFRSAKKAGSSEENPTRLGVCRPHLLERAIDRFDVPLTRARKIERRMLREFRRRAHHYTSGPPDQGDNLEWLALMQHHGGPTRLLDWTYSFYVALYFAMKSVKRNGCAAVWAVNDRWSTREARCIVGPEGARHLARFEQDRRPEHFDAVFMKRHPNQFVYLVTPFRLNERLTSQQGVFLCPGDPSVPFENNLRSMPGHHYRKNLVKIVVPGTARTVALRYLRRMNIDSSTLFPGLDGFAESLETRAQFYQ